MSAIPLISIIIPVYNCENDISFAIDSVLNQNFLDEELEIIIINDGSTDNTKTIINSYSDKHLFINAFHQSNIGIGKTRNVGISYTKGKYIYFLDADDFLAPHSLKPILEKMSKDNLDLVGFKCKNTALKQVESVPNIEESIINSKIISGANFIEKNDFMHTVWWYICNRDFLLKTGLKIAEGNEFEDSIFTTNLLFLTKKMIFLPLNIYNYYLRESSIMNSQEPEHNINMVYMYLNTIISYSSFINKIEKDKAMTKTLIKKIKTRQQWFAFFGISRAIKSKMPVKEIHHILNKMTLAKAYPLNDFIGVYNKGRKLELFTFLFNRKYLLYSVIYIYRKISIKKS